MNKKQLSTLLLLIALGATGMAFRTAKPFQMAKFTSPASADNLVNPFKGDAAATADGKKIYETNCTICHGAKGMGDGIAAAGLAKPPANHSSAAVQKVSDGGLFWMITNGNNPMPAYKTTFSDNQRWQLVNYIRTLAKPIKK